MKNTIINVAEYNANNISHHIKFRNEDGSLRTRGFVVTNGTSAIFCKTRAIAEQTAATKMDDNDYASCTAEASMNS